MPVLSGVPRSRRLLVAGVVLAVAVVAWALRGPLLRVGRLLLGAALLCFIASPVAWALEGKLNRPLATLVALLSVVFVAAALIALLLPNLLRETVGLAQALPAMLRQASELSEQARIWLQGRLPGISLPALDLSVLQGRLPDLAGGTVGLAVNLADLIGDLSLATMLAFFMLCDRERLLLRLELLLPQSARHTAVRMGNAVCRELRLYLRGQLLIALAVAALATLALMLLGVRSALALGALIGLMNMIPYLGPFIGGAPAVLIALGDGWQKAALTVASLAIVQQLDGSLISPRVMGSLTGFSPALVLVGVYAGARLCGMGGMLLALPAMMVTRTLFRVFVQKCENI